MTLTLHRHEYTMHRPSDGRVLYRQVCWTFGPTAATETVSSATGIVGRRTASEPAEVKVPAFSEVRSGRLIVATDPLGWPAEMVASAAEGKRGGFAWVEK